MRWITRTGIGSVVGIGVALAATSALADATLSIEFSGSSGPFAIGNMVQVKVRMSDIPALQPAAGFQAFVEFDSTRLAFVSAAYTSAPFGQHIIVPVALNGNQIDMAAGINVFIGELPTAADADLVYLTFQALTACGVGTIEFRPHDPPSRLTMLGAVPITPLNLVSIEANPTCPADVEPVGGGNGSVDVDDLIRVILSWGNCPPTPGCCPGNADGNATVDVDDLIAVILGWGVCP